MIRKIALILCLAVVATACVEYRKKNEAQVIREVKPAMYVKPKTKRQDNFILEQMKSMPTLKNGKTANLKYDDGHRRVWLRNDNSEYFIEMLVDGKWVDASTGERI